MNPVPLSQEMLVAVLRNMADLVEQGDSFEGSIEYMLPTGDIAAAEDMPDERAYAMVRASYRIGNSMGQGGVRMIGE